VWIPALIETPLVSAENARSSSGWHSNVQLLLNFIMSFLCTVFSWAFPFKDIVRIPAAMETPLVPAENVPSSSGWHSNVVLLLNLMMSFLGLSQVISSTKQGESSNPCNFNIFLVNAN
jgi:hypothetical protein